MTGLLLPSPLAAVFLALLVVPLCIVVRTDLSQRRIPDGANLGIALLGLGHVLALDPPGAFGRLVEAGLVVVLLVALRALYRRLRGVTGLGLGDVKFLGAATLWTGIAGLAPLLAVASLAAIAAVGIARLAGRRVGRATRIPFGPFLVAGLVAVLALDVAIPAAPWPPA